METFVIDTDCVQDERYAFRLKLRAKVTAVAAKDSACKVGNIGQVGMVVLGQHGFCSHCLKHTGRSVAIIQFG